MERELVRAVLAPLQLSGSLNDVQAIRRLEPGDWRRILSWLDDCGLALYFLRSLQNMGATEALPSDVLARLEQNLLQNRARWESIAKDFSCINEGFKRAGVRFAVIKGLSLVPDYCPDAVLRAPSDLDYLVDQQSLSLARSVLEGAGYHLQKQSDIEVTFRKPVSRIPRISDSPYSVNTDLLIELHFSFWMDENNVPLADPMLSLEQTTTHEWRGLHFPVLNDCDAFLLQVLHVFQHTLVGWVKLCWLFEIGSFLSKRSGDLDFWRQVDQRIQAVPNLAEFTAVVIEMARIVFGASRPYFGENWIFSLRSTSRLWLENYAEIWAFDGSPHTLSRFFRTAKLSLFLSRGYIPDPEMRREMTWRHLFPWKRMEGVGLPVDRKPTKVGAAILLQRRFVLDRIIFHSGSTLRYLWEVPRWRKLQSETPPHPAS